MGGPPSSLFYCFKLLSRLLRGFADRSPDQSKLRFFHWQYLWQFVKTGIYIPFQHLSLLLMPLLAEAQRPQPVHSHCLAILPRHLADHPSMAPYSLPFKSENYYDQLSCYIHSETVSDRPLSPMRYSPVNWEPPTVTLLIHRCPSQSPLYIRRLNRRNSPEITAQLQKMRCHLPVVYQPLPDDRRNLPVHPLLLLFPLLRVIGLLALPES